MQAELETIALPKPPTVVGLWLRRISATRRLSSVNFTLKDRYSRKQAYGTVN